MARVLVLTDNPDVRRRVRQAVEGPSPAFYENERALLLAVKRSVCDAVIVGLRDEESTTEIDLIRLIREQYPIVWVIGCLERRLSRQDEIRLVATVTRSGANDVIVDDLESYAWVSERLALVAAELVVIHRIGQATGTCVPETVQRFIEHGVLRARRSVSVNEIAQNLGVSRQTVARQCRKAELPCPEQLLTWSRLLFASALLDQPGMTADRVGHRMFGSPSVFRKLLQTYAGVPPNLLRSEGGFELMLSTFTRTLVA